MTTARKPKPEYLTRAEVEAMIAAAVAAKRERNSRAVTPGVPMADPASPPLGIRTSPTFRTR